MAEEKKKLGSNDLDKISGGYYYHADEVGVGALRHEVLDEEYNTVAAFDNKDDAIKFAESKGISTKTISKNDLEEVMCSPRFSDKHAAAWLELTRDQQMMELDKRRKFQMIRKAKMKKSQNGLNKLTK